MVTAPAAADAIARARRLPELGVGLHLVLVEGEPRLPADAVPDLVDASGHFRTDMISAAVAIFFSPRVRKQLAAEITAQFAAFRDSGLALDHVNAHKHFHLHPTIASHVMDIGRRFGMKALRVPYEPPPANASGAFSVCARLLKLRTQRRGFVSADRTFGNAWSGAMTESRLAKLISELPPGVTEIYGHPATSEGFAGAAPGYRYAEEFAALTSTSIRSGVRSAGAIVTTFAAIAHK